MNKHSLSQILDGAAFPAIILAIAVSQTKVGPYRKNAHFQGKGVAEELRVDERFKQELRKRSYIEVYKLLYACPVQEQRPRLRAQLR
jgi:hypothetical protein